ncbi:hypothetical protein ATCC51561_502 [Campylobacter concisus ATCC 51561]|nr:hypothetical protein ATCC51561_502 [Campylobacter concisus ATCC 51561]
MAAVLAQISKKPWLKIIMKQIIVLMKFKKSCEIFCQL